MQENNAINANVQVGGNVEGSVVIGHNNFVVNNNHGTIVRQEALAVQRRSLSPQPPAEPEGFVGRKTELKRVVDLIAEGKTVVIVGVDGIGKTSLIKEAANSESAKAQPDGVVFVDALDEDGNLLEFGDLVQRIFDALFESRPHEKVNLTSARTYLSNYRPLVLLNSIKLNSQNINQLRDLFTKAPILITTQDTALTIGRTFIRLGPLNQDDSLNLLASLTSLEDQETFAKIATLLENVPAALSMAAYTISGYDLSPEDLLSRLQEHTPTEKNKEKAALERVFYVLSSLLSEDQRATLDQVASGFGVSVDRKWLEAVFGADTVRDLEARGLLHANSPRLRLLPGLKPILLEGRDFTKERQRLLDYLLEELKTRWKDFEFIKDELGNLLGLLGWAVATGQWANVAALGRAIDPYLTLSGQWDAWHKTLKSTQEAADTMKDLALQGWILHQLGTYEIGMGNSLAAQKLLEEAVKIRTQLGDQIGAAYSRHNLQVIAPAVTPGARPTNVMPWVLGGLAVITIASFLIFAQRPPKAPPLSPTAAPISVAASEAPLVASAAPTSMVTSTLTETLSPSATTSVTFTPSPTGTPTVTPTYAILSKVVVNALAACFYGPSNVYLNKGTRRIRGNTVDLLGRIETDKGIWVNTRFSLPRTDASDPCWMNAKYLDITQEQLMSVKPIDPANPKEYKLPIAYDSTTRLNNPVVKDVARTGNIVKVSWEYFDVGTGQYPNNDETFPRYLIEAWLCKAGKIVFSPSGWGPYGPDVPDGITVFANLQDEPGCTEPSHARLYLAWAHGYAGPSEIQPWPQSETVLPASTPTP